MRGPPARPRDRGARSQDNTATRLVRDDNGQLLKLAAADFDVFLTVDRNLSFQQPVIEFDITVVVLSAVTNRLVDLKVLVPELLEALPETKPGQVTWIGT